MGHLFARVYKEDRRARLSERPSLRLEIPQLIFLYCWHSYRGSQPALLVLEWSSIQSEIRIGRSGCCVSLS